MKVEVVSMYAPDQDITVISKRTYDDNGEECSIEVTGFYHGKPTDANNAKYDGQLVATYDNIEPDQDILQAKAMLQYMDKVMDEWHNAIDDTLNEKFYNLPIMITFGEQTFAIRNNASIFEAVKTCMEYFIDNY